MLRTPPPADRLRLALLDDGQRPRGAAGRRPHRAVGRGPGLATLVAALALLAGGCAVDADDLKTWKGVAGGADRLAGYYHDGARPLALRAVAAQALFDLDRVDHLIGVVRETPAAERGPLVSGLGGIARATLADGAAEALHGRAAHLGYAVLEFHEALPEAERAPLVDALLTWALRLYGAEPTNLPKAPAEIIAAAAVVDAARARAALAAWLAGPVDDRVALAMLDVIKRLRDPELDAAVAATLLARAQADFPALSPQRVDLLLANGNETLLKFLLASVADVRVPFAARAAAMNEASRRLKAAGLDLYLELLAVDDAANGNQARLMALDLVWAHGGVERLADALRALPPKGTWPVEGEEMRAQVREFCDASLARQRVAARPVLLNLLEDASWVARAYALECIVRLYPEDAPDMLAGLAEDATPLRGWVLEGETTVGAVVQALRTE